MKLLGEIGSLLCLMIGLYYGFNDDYASGTYFLVLSTLNKFGDIK